MFLAVQGLNKLYVTEIDKFFVVDIQFKNTVFFFCLHSKLEFVSAIPASNEWKIITNNSASQVLKSYRVSHYTKWHSWPFMASYL